MHIHANPLSVQAANFYSSQLEQEVDARREADRKRRLRRVSEALATDSDTTPEESLLISHWRGAEEHAAPVRAALEGDEYHASSQTSSADDDLLPFA